MSRQTRLNLAGTAAVIAGVLVLGGCTAAEPSGDVELTMTVWGGEVDQKTYSERIALAEKKFPGVSIKLEQVAEGYDQKLQTRIAGGNSPDIVQVAEAVNVYASKGQLLDLAPAFDEAGTDVDAQFGESNASIFREGDKLWAAPDRAGAMVLYYNKKLFDEAGVEYPNAEWGWDEFRSAAKELTVRDGDDITQFGFAAGDWWPWYMTFMLQNGGTILDEDGKPQIDSPENVEALEFYHDMVFEDGSAPTPVDYANLGLKDSQADPLFVQGKLAMVATGFWSVPYYDTIDDLEWGVSPIWQGEKQATPAFFSGLAVSAASKHPDIATDVVQFLASADGQLPIAANGEDVPASLEIASSPEFTDPEWLKSDVPLTAFAESAEYSYVPPLVPEFNEIVKAFTDNMAGVWLGEEPVQAGLTKVQSAVESIMAE